MQYEIEYHVQIYFYIARCNILYIIHFITFYYFSVLLHILPFLFLFDYNLLISQNVSYF